MLNDFDDTVGHNFSEIGYGSLSNFDDWCVYMATIRLGQELPLTEQDIEAINLARIMSEVIAMYPEDPSDEDRPPGLHYMELLISSIQARAEDGGAMVGEDIAACMLLSRLAVRFMSNPFLSPKQGGLFDAACERIESGTPLNSPDLKTLRDIVHILWPSLESVR